MIILCPYPYGKSPSQRFRFEQFLSQEGSPKVPVRSFYTKASMKALYGSNILLKLIFLKLDFLKRWLHFFEACFHHSVFIHREVSPMGPPIFEYLLKVLGKKIYYDFDDAIWISNVSEVNRSFDKLKAYWKVPKIISWADKVYVGNTFLAEYASNYNEQVNVLPSTVDMIHHHNQSKVIEEKDEITIGWTGSHTTAAKYLPGLKNIMDQLNQQYKIKVLIISNQVPQLDFNHDFIPWNADSEIDDLLKIDIGIMPLAKESWEKGKCSFKAIQYMSLGIPTVLSPYGHNIELVKENETGLFADLEQEWLSQLSRLIEDYELRQKLGKKGKEYIQANYSMEAQLDNYKSIFT